MNKPRRHFSGPEKVAILKRHSSKKSPSPTSAMNSASPPTSSTAGRKSSSTTATPPSTTTASPGPSRTPRTRRSSCSKPSCNAKTRLRRRTHGGARPAEKDLGNPDRMLGSPTAHPQPGAVDFVRAWADKTDIPVCRFLPWIGIGAGKFHDWKRRFGKVNEHNTWVPRDHWLTEPEKEAVRLFARQHPLEGYRRQTFMMLDANVVACNPPASTASSRPPDSWPARRPRPPRKARASSSPCDPMSTGTSMSAISTSPGQLFFLCSVLDGCSRFIVHWEDPRQNGGIRRANHHPTRPRKGSRPDAAGSSPTTGRNSSPRTSRSSSASAA